MVQRIDRDAVRDLIDGRDARLLEVLPRAEYEWAHLPGARHLPLGELDGRVAADQDPSRPVVVYCHDWMCDLSARAAHRLERLGAGEVYDYPAGKMDWLAAGLPYEGHAVLVSRVMRRDPVVAFPEDPVEDLGERILADPAGVAVVVTREGRIVQGLVGSGELKDAPPGAAAEQVLCHDITTVRPAESLEGLLERMDGAGVHAMAVTLPDGALAGLFVTDATRPPESDPDL
ncbi:rhodanese-like domain-containing protein [Planomonospora corallina]|uniref:Rhodanese-like domain-containing protein n=1 Tax=Planomonospora corallina TaxID=1806052 RepID=A0ABV8ILY7_9ACTN